MVKFERQSIIEQELVSQGFILIPAMSALLQCSEETIRRDLKEMEKAGKLTRTHGGAYLIEKYDKSYPTALRKTYMHRAKGKMAHLAMQHIRENDVIMLDSSTTCLALAETLAQSKMNLTIITNSLPICNLCNDSNTNINSVQRYSDCPDTDYVLPQLYLVLRRLYCLDIGRMRMSCWWVGVRSSRSSRLPIPSPLIRLIRSPVPLKSPAIHEYCQFTVPHSLVQLLDQWLGFD